MKENKVIVLDFGGQYAHLIANRVRRLGVYSEIRLPDAPLEELENCRGIILSGGPASVYDSNAPAFNKGLFSVRVPVLGICYGLQLMAQELGGVVKRGATREYGTALLQVRKGEGVLEGLNGSERVWMSHGDRVEGVPKGFDVLASTTDCEFAAVGDPARGYYGIQFHPEVTHTEKGMSVLSNFVFGVCGCERDWDMKAFTQGHAQSIKEQVGGKKVLLLVSGGVDSSVTAALLAKTLPKEQVLALHIDNGLMRKNESKQVEKALMDAGVANLKVVHAQKEFLAALNGVCDPEEKRKVIGRKFIEVSNREAGTLGFSPKDFVLAQGTIYPDTIETGGTRNAVVIKTHHNRVDLVQEMIAEGRVVEPIKELYKDEVRALGKELGLPADLIERHPFPGPGLGIRVLCSQQGVLPENALSVEEKINAFTQTLGLKAKILPIKSVGVQGDERSYANPVALHGAELGKGVTWGALERASTGITNNHREVNRVVFLLSPREIESVAALKKSIDAERIALEQEADFITMNALREKGLLGKVWQCPTVLAPIGVNSSSRESIVLRPVLSTEAMTARFADLDYAFVEGLAGKLSRLHGAGAVFYDVTHKPPGTIEWE
ncbi:MAG TPA: glutamine-hydrolyzing GMP synthase [archaeon]|nr:glutamine-hydrolyzing GMP synthase [archaeon]